MSLFTKKKPEFIIVLDFDNTITDYDDQLSKERADHIADILERLLKKYPVQLVLLSWANRSHILYVTRESGSVRLLKILRNNLMLTEENPSLFTRFFKKGNPTQQRQKQRMILEVMKDSTLTKDPECLRASKKTTSLRRLSSLNHIPPERIFFLDDNWHNVRFAKNYGFISYRVMNDKPSKNIFSFLEKIESLLTQTINGKKEKSPVSLPRHHRKQKTQQQIS